MFPRIVNGVPTRGDSDSNPNRELHEMRRRRQLQRQEAAQAANEPRAEASGDAAQLVNDSRVEAQLEKRAQKRQKKRQKRMKRSMNTLGRVWADIASFMYRRLHWIVSMKGLIGIYMQYECICA